MTIIFRAQALIESLGVGYLALDHRQETCNILVFSSISDALLGALGASALRWEYDLDEVEAIDHKKRALVVRVQLTALIVIKILQRDEFCSLLTAIHQCHRLKDLYLRQMVVTSDVLACLGRVAPPPADFERYGLHLIMTARKKAIVTCLYCGRSKRSVSSGLFFLHPWVPYDFSGREVILCEMCLANWRKYRGNKLPSISVRDRQCSICSVAPKALKPCARCPRSFCKDCLQELLDATALMLTRTSADWTCMACFHQLPSGLSPTLYIVETSVSLNSLDIYRRAARRAEADAADLALELFREYVQRHPEVREQAARGISEDFCFVCKDGGDLIECEARLCGKVFHRECLAFPPQGSAEEPWSCPRHLCAQCGSDAITFACVYCPSSYCSPCCEAGLKSDALQVFQVLSHATFELPVPVTPVICSYCLDIAKKAFSPQKLHDLQQSWSLHFLWSDDVRDIEDKTTLTTL